MSCFRPDCIGHPAMDRLGVVVDMDPATKTRHVFMGKNARILTMDVSVSGHLLKHGHFIYAENIKSTAREIHKWKPREGGRSEFDGHTLRVESIFIFPPAELENYSLLFSPTLGAIEIGRRIVSEALAIVQGRRHDAVYQSWMIWDPQRKQFYLNSVDSVHETILPNPNEDYRHFVKMSPWWAQLPASSYLKQERRDLTAQSSSSSDEDIDPYERIAIVLSIKQYMAEVYVLDSVDTSMPKRIRKFDVRLRRNTDSREPEIGDVVKFSLDKFDRLVEYAVAPSLSNVTSVRRGLEAWLEVRVNVEAPVTPVKDRPCLLLHNKRTGDIYDLEGIVDRSPLWDRKQRKARVLARLQHVLIEAPFQRRFMLVAAEIMPLTDSDTSGNTSATMRPSPNRGLRPLWTGQQGAVAAARNLWPAARLPPAAVTDASPSYEDSEPFTIPSDYSTSTSESEAEDEPPKTTLTEMSRKLEKSKEDDTERIRRAEEERPAAAKRAAQVLEDERIARELQASEEEERRLARQREVDAAQEAKDVAAWAEAAAEKERLNQKTEEEAKKRREQRNQAALEREERENAEYEARQRGTWIDPLPPQPAVRAPRAEPSRSMPSLSSSTLAPPPYSQLMSTPTRSLLPLSVTLNNSAANASSYFPDLDSTVSSTRTQSSSVAAPPTPPPYQNYSPNRYASNVARMQQYRRDIPSNGFAEIYRQIRVTPRSPPRGNQEMDQRPVSRLSSISNTSVNSGDVFNQCFGSSVRGLSSTSSSSPRQRSPPPRYDAPPIVAPSQLLPSTPPRPLSAPHGEPPRYEDIAPSPASRSGSDLTVSSRGSSLSDREMQILRCSLRIADIMQRCPMACAMLLNEDAEIQRDLQRSIENYRR